MRLLTWEGTIGRRAYALTGLILFAVKYAIDRTVASFFDRSWPLYSYLIPAASGSILGIHSTDWPLYCSLLLIAFPFIYIGTMLTVRRLRAIKASEWLVLLFFLPVVNLIFFLILCILPSTATEEPVVRVGKVQGSSLLDRLIPESGFGSAMVALLVNGLSAVLFTRFSAYTLKNYGWGLFVGLPFCLGFSSVLIFSYHRYRSISSCIGVAAGSVALAGIALMLFAMEGAICIIMAAPLAIGLGILGGWLGYLLQLRPRTSWENGHLLSLLLLTLPAYMSVEHISSPPPELFAVQTSVEIAAPPELVWKYVVAFAELPPPTEWIFRTGVAYPVKAVINGTGVGAVRHCVFSTGPFVEPIQIWNEPRLLAFTVTSTPPPMQEWSFRRDVYPPHLDNFLISRKGQFELRALLNGHTRLIGTTWYQHHMWPAFYWRLWSDFMIHRIHLRVLQYIKLRAETT